MVQPPTRIALIGISAKAWWGASAHLPYLKAHPEEYKIVALCNSSVENAKAAIEKFELGGNVKAYGDVEDVAKDPEIDLVVVSVNVSSHNKAAAPSLRAGKNVYVEWPLGKNLTDAKELLEMSKSYGVKKTCVGLQARQAPVIKKVRELIAEGRIGSVCSSTWSSVGLFGAPSTPENVKYFHEKDCGGNFWTIHFGHAIDYIQAVLGYGFVSPPKSLLATQRKTIQITNAEGEVIDPAFPNQTPDTMFLHGTLTGNIPLSCQLIAGQGFPGTPALDWRITGTEGTIRITASGPFIQIGYPDLKLEVEKGGKVEVLEVADADIPWGNVGRVYKGLREGNSTASFEEAVELHALLDGAEERVGVWRLTVDRTVEDLWCLGGCGTLN